MKLANAVIHIMAEVAQSAVLEINVNYIQYDLKPYIYTILFMRRYTVYKSR